MSAQFVLPYSSTEDLGEEVRQHWAAIQKEANPRLKLMPPKKEVDRAFALYQNAMSPKLPAILLGSEHIREDEELVYNFGTLSTDPQTSQKAIKTFFQQLGYKIGKTLNELCLQHVTQGAILNESNWWVFPNDMAMLGGIHAGKEFHLAYTGMKGVDKGLPSLDLLWDSANKRPRALGREITMLRLSGYTPAFVRVAKKTGVVFIPPEKPVLLSLSEMRQRLQNVRRSDIMVYLLSMIPLQITRPLSASPSDGSERTSSPPSELAAPSTIADSSRSDSPPSLIDLTGSVDSSRTSSPPSRVDSLGAGSSRTVSPASRVDSDSSRTVSPSYGAYSLSSGAGAGAGRTPSPPSKSGKAEAADDTDVIYEEPPEDVDYDSDLDNSGAEKKK